MVLPLNAVRFSVLIAEDKKDFGEITLESCFTSLSTYFAPDKLHVFLQNIHIMLPGLLASQRVDSFDMLRLRGQGLTTTPHK
jgi:hypothetical protein